MKLPRRNFLHLAAGATALPAVSRIAWAQAYPTRPVRIVCGYPPGGVVDIYARLIAYAKNNPGKVTVASAGIGSAPHMYWELFRSVTGVEMLHVPYRGGGPALTDLLGGQVQAYFGTSASTIEYVRTGKLRALAVTSATRAAALPEVPAMAEFLPTYEASIYVGIVAPRNTPPDIIGRLNQEINI